MARRRNNLRPPAEYVDTWPDGSPFPEAPAAVRYAQGIASSLAKALENRTVVGVAEAADVDRGTIYDLLSGSTWPDIVIVSALEEALGVNLFPVPRPSTS